MTVKHSSSPSLPANLTLGQKVDYIEQYTPELLQGVPRSLSREQIGVSQPLPFGGVDIWNGYELSWLNPKGKPQVAILQCQVPIDSQNLIESKSFKLYLNSFNQSVFGSADEVARHLSKDLSACAQAPVKVQLFSAGQFGALHLGELDGTVIDDLDIEINAYEPSPELLTTGDQQVSETLVSHLLKSNCLITSQPDWASVQIHYEGAAIDHAGLLAYLISFRRHNEFHEQCIERIFCDLMNRCKPHKLAVYARYTRRGGLDINPLRANFDFNVSNNRLARQ
ncbi:NADPH-dependent 7-cyano-7-deazaguanine reductase QueF [Alteromonas sp. McT4-15]|jgi:7-cyano-7-deazaguanine reductase|uniref:NADPH-dependent 7-cyano-7-deazaguanine reductase n=1 Tax=Alteromonas alba TaxID=2079529 RepID=A0A2S9VD34_9ALTE|nr:MULTISPECIES: NADPH-dependent 7-cyano-7-deazaguanine reductase QueF [Alteromonas]APE04609.1 NADPH-dependent 7-cyano-7-deazaguanine reductase QueF [Alteromonas sp. RW2A1]MCB4438287.1 NADPH-dependent 7-cyano-7-deazaguanine reductase QueF [Alteromonas sp. McT4-15]PRO74378.1 NADPH-dependent 7-cyano-7-deazaguanine reductase QueF [Alteromonas alba]|tara:strand:+ start:1151 stop:1993 length:843 start_codon:yes stop_codon:yes gene_type:complete